MSILVGVIGSSAVVCVLALCLFYICRSLLFDPHDIGDHDVS